MQVLLSFKPPFVSDESVRFDDLTVLSLLDVNTVSVVHWSINATVIDCIPGRPSEMGFATIGLTKDIFSCA